MARVNVEQSALSDQSDPRFKILGKEIGVDRWAALGRMCAIWNLCQERETYVLDLETVNSLFDDVPRMSDALLKSGLGKKHRHGVYISGTRGRVEWLANKRRAGRENGKLGGRPKKTEAEPTKNRDGLPTETPPAPAPAPAPAVKKKTPSESQKKTRLQESWQPKPQTREWAEKKFPQISFDLELDSFRDWHIGKGTVWFDWDRALQSWFRKSAERYPRQTAQKTLTMIRKSE